MGSNWRHKDMLTNWNASLTKKKMYKRIYQWNFCVIRLTCQHLKLSKLKELEKGTLKKFRTGILKEENTFFKKGIYLRSGCCIGLPTSSMDHKRMVASILLISCQTNGELVCIWILYQINLLLPSIWLSSHSLLLHISYFFFVWVIGRLYSDTIYMSVCVCDSTLIECGFKHWRSYVLISNKLKNYWICYFQPVDF